MEINSKKIIALVFGIGYVIACAYLIGTSGEMVPGFEEMVTGIIAFYFISGTVERLKK